MFRIAAFARLAGVSAKTLRAWDEERLFRPAWVDPHTAYRYYSPAQLPELRRIVALRDLGVPLAEIAGLVARRSDLRPVLERRRIELERERAEVERRLRALDITVAAGEGTGDATHGPAVPDVVVRPLDRELVAVLAWPEHGDVAAAFSALETAVRDAGIRAGRPPGALATATDDWAILVPLTARRALPAPIEVRELAPVRVASAIHRGPYDGLVPLRERLQAWVQATGRTASGGSRIRYLQFGAEPELRLPAGYVVDDDRDFVTELQLELA